MTPGESHNEWYHYYCSNFFVFKRYLFYKPYKQNLNIVMTLTFDSKAMPEIKQLTHHLQSFTHLGQTLCQNNNLSYDVASERKITTCIKIDKPLVVYRFTENVMTSIATLRT